MMLIFRKAGGALQRVLDSVGGRTFVFLTLGIVAAAAVSVTLAEGPRRRDFETLRTNQLLDRAVQIKERWMSALTPEVAQAEVQGILGVRIHQAPVPCQRFFKLQEKLATAMGADLKPTGGAAPSAACLPPGFKHRIPSQLGNGFELKLDC